MTEDQPSPPPERSVIETRREYLEAFDALIGLAARELRIFDPDLAQLALETPDRLDRLGAFLRRTRGNRLFIALHQPALLMQRSPRFTRLVALFSDDVAVHRTTGEAERAQDCFVLADREHFVRRPVAAHPRGVFVRHDPHEGALMRERFDQIWESSEATAPPTTLGL